MTFDTVPTETRARFATCTMVEVDINSVSTASGFGSWAQMVNYRKYHPFFECQSKGKLAEMQFSRL